MSPRFDELAGDATGAERERLRRVHDALVAAGPPPEPGTALRDAPPVAARVLPFRRRPHVAFLLPAAAAAAAFAIGFWVGDRGDSFSENRAVAMHAVPDTLDASASILVGERDDVGNRPLLVRAHGLPALEPGGWYVLFLTRDGKKIAPCGTFVVDAEGVTEVQMTVPYDLDDYDGWIVAAYDPVTHETGGPLLATEEF